MIASIVQQTLPLVPVYNDLLQPSSRSFLSTEKESLFSVVWCVVNATTRPQCVDEGT